MSTRGAYGIRINGRDMIAYNHSDSYPDGLGNDILAAAKQLTAAGIDHLREKATQLRQIRKDSPPTKQDIDALQTHTDLTVGARSDQDWYCLMRGMQGDLAAHFTTGYFPPDNAGFLGDSLFCEWAYILNLDDRMLEVYKGFQKSPHSKGRYGHLKHGEYYGVALIAQFPLTNLPPDLSSVENTDDDE